MNALQHLNWRRSWLNFISLSLLSSAGLIHGLWIHPLQNSLESLSRRTNELNQAASRAEVLCTTVTASNLLLKKQQEHLDQMLGDLAKSPAEVRGRLLQKEPAGVVQVLWSNPEKAKARDLWSLRRLPVQMSCNYQDLREFLKRLAQLSQIVGVVECEIEPTEATRNLINARIVLEIPVRKLDPEETAAP